MKNWLLLNNSKSIKHKTCLITSLVLLFFLRSLGQQNLVKNFSFEQYSTCPNTYGQIFYSNYWFQPVGVIVGQSSTDYFNSCSTNTVTSVPNNFVGYQTAKSGNSYSGFIISGPGSPINLREFIEGQLIDTLKPNTKYCVSVYSNLANQSQYATDILNYLFSADTFKMATDSVVYGNFPSDFDSLNLSTNYNDTVNWFLSSGVYVANGTESFITFGNFNVETLINYYTANPSGNFPYPYYYFDNFSVIEIVNVKTVNDTLINNPASILLGLNTDTTAFYEWWPHTGIADTNEMNPVATVNQTTMYYVKKTQCGEVSIDSVLITVSPIGLKDWSASNNKFLVYPNPSNGEFEIRNEAGIPFSGALILTDVYGKLIKEESINDAKQIDVNIKNETEKGVYFLKLYDENGSLSFVYKLIFR